MNRRQPPGVGRDLSWALAFAVEKELDRRGSPVLLY